MPRRRGRSGGPPAGTRRRCRGSPSSVSGRPRGRTGPAPGCAGFQSFVGRTGHLRLPSVTSAPLMSFAVAPSLPVSIGSTIGWRSMPGGGLGLVIGGPLYFAVPPSKTQSQPLPSVTAWYAAAAVGAEAARLGQRPDLPTVSYEVHASVERGGRRRGDPMIGYGSARACGTAEQVRAEQPERPVAGDRQDLRRRLRPVPAAAGRSLPGRPGARPRSRPPRRMAPPALSGGCSTRDAAGHRRPAAAASALSWSSVIVALRFVSPVTTASGKSARAAGASGSARREGSAAPARRWVRRRATAPSWGSSVWQPASRAARMITAGTADRRRPLDGVRGAGHGAQCYRGEQGAAATCRIIWRPPRS